MINRGGGVTDAGNKERTYVVRANGLVESSAAYTGLFGNGLMGLTLEPGDAVVVPVKDPNSADAWSIIKESLGVLGTTIGITANSMAILQTLGVLKLAVEVMPRTSPAYWGKWKVARIPWGHCGKTQKLLLTEELTGCGQEPARKFRMRDPRPKAQSCPW